ncbi:MAG: hypothetical protein HFJ46_05200 [Clostridia bacterium]|nr:hypothetical protein [Clostridia bacterium]
MRFYELINLSDEEANELIKKSPRIEMKEVLEHPEDFVGKLLVFRGNYDGFATNRRCARTFEYILSKQRWRVSDVTIYDMFSSSFAYLFSSKELKEKFKAFCEAKAFVMDV